MFRSYPVLAIVAISLVDLGLVVGECPGSYTEVGGGCFMVLPEAVSEFTAARLICQDYNGDLAIVDDCALLGSLATYIESLGISSVGGLWVGGSDLATEGEWLWLDGSPVPMGAPFWGRLSPGDFNLEPSGGTVENCAVLSAVGGFYFQDINCGTYPNYAPLCQGPPLAGTNGSCQPPFVSVGGDTCLDFLSTVDVSWDDARTVCQNNGGELAIIGDCHLMEAVISYAQEHGVVPASGFWIGGTDVAIEGTWTWLDGSFMAMGAPFWGRSGSGPLQPDDSGDSEDCLEIIFEDRYRFNDNFCTSSRPPLCQTDPIQEDSSVNGTLEAANKPTPFVS